jgi:hypothetical protein
MFFLQPKLMRGQKKKLIWILFLSLALVHCGAQPQKSKSPLPDPIPEPHPVVTPPKTDRPQSVFTVDPKIEENCKTIVTDPKVCKDMNIQIAGEILEFVAQVSGFSGPIYGICFPAESIIIENPKGWLDKNHPEFSDTRRLEVTDFINKKKEDGPKKYGSPPPWMFLQKDLKSEFIPIVVTHEYAHYIFGWENSKIKTDLLPKSPLMKEDLWEKAIQDEIDEKTVIGRLYETTEKIKKATNFSSLIQHYSNLSEEFSYTFQALSLIKKAPQSSAYDFMKGLHEPSTDTAGAATTLRESWPLFQQRYFIEIWKRVEEGQKQSQKPPSEAKKDAKTTSSKSLKGFKDLKN